MSEEKTAGTALAEDILSLKLVVMGLTSSLVNSGVIKYKDLESMPLYMSRQEELKQMLPELDKAVLELLRPAKDASQGLDDGLTD